MPETGDSVLPLVSAIIPTYNRAALVLRAIRSAVKQTYSKMEVIVVDDASRDATQPLVEGLKDNRVRYVRHLHTKGAAAARNTGIEHARGAFVAFLDDDDQWMPQKVARQFQEIGENDGVLCGFALTRSSRLRRGTRARGIRTRIDRQAWRQGFYVGWGTSSILVRRQVVERVRFDEELPCGQDWDFMIRASEQYRFGYFDERLVLIDNDGTERISTRPVTDVEQAESRMRVLQKHRMFLGPFWYKYHAALTLLRGRPDKLRSLPLVIRRYGVPAVVAGYLFRLYRDVFA